TGRRNSKQEDTFLFFRKYSGAEKWGEETYEMKRKKLAEIQKQKAESSLSAPGAGTCDKRNGFKRVLLRGAWRSGHFGH
ncbi:hypothetical protein, partial [Salmonella enterica]|uniref:hypothetical protein n=1 Tax=Salmonella enterica TaxID=28901 RepID=UPI001C4E21C0